MFRRCLLPAALLLVLAGVSLGDGASEGGAPVPTPEDLGLRLVSRSVEERRHAVHDLWLRRAEADPAASALARALRDEDAYVRETAARVLERLVERSTQAVPEVGAALSDERAAVRLLAAQVLAWAGGGAVQAREPVVRALSDPDAPVRRAAAEVLCRLDPADGGPAIAALQRAARDADAGVRAAAAYAAIRLDAAGAADVVAASLDDESPLVRSATLKALYHAQSPEACPVARVAALARTGDEPVRREACFALGLCGAGDEDAREALLACLRDEGAALRIAAAVSLQQIGPADGRVIAALEHALRDEVNFVVRYAARALGRAGPAAAGAVPALAEVLRAHPDEPTRIAAAAAIGEVLGPRVGRALPSLSEAVRDAGKYAGIAAAVALLRIRPDDAPARARLHAALADAELRPTALALGKDLPPDVLAGLAPPSPRPPGAGAPR